MKGVLVELHSESEASLLAQSWDAKALKAFPTAVIFVTAKVATNYSFIREKAQRKTRYSD